MNRQECLHWLRQHFCATRTATATLFSQVALRLRGAITALLGPCSSRQRGFFKVSRILPWQRPSSPPPTSDATTTPFLAHSLWSRRCLSSCTVETTDFCDLSRSHLFFELDEAVHVHLFCCSEEHLLRPACYSHYLSSCTAVVGRILAEYSRLFLCFHSSF